MAFSIGSWYWTVATHDGILREQAGDISPGKQFNVRILLIARVPECAIPICNM